MKNYAKFIMTAQEKIDSSLISNKTLGDMIKAKRISLGLSQDALSECVDVERKTIARIENGKETHFMVIAKIAIALELSLDDLCIKRTN